jgi:hypothetical protein
MRQPCVFASNFESQKQEKSNATRGRRRRESKSIRVNKLLNLLLSIDTKNIYIEI